MNVNKATRVKRHKFIMFISGFLIGKGECETLVQAVTFAESLEQSFIEDYNDVPLMDWPALAEKDYSEYLESKRRFDQDVESAEIQLGL